jgi:hypothetical protein
MLLIELAGYCVSHIWGKGASTIVVFRRKLLPELKIEVL